MSPDTRLIDLPILFDSLALADEPYEVQHTIARIDACLPQTQCGLCDHADGCLPYAAAIVLSKEPHNKCVPGGQPVTDAIARVLADDADQQDHTISTTGTPASPALSTPAIPNTAHTPAIRTSTANSDTLSSATADLRAVPSKWPIDNRSGRPVDVRAIIREDDCIGCTKCIPACPVDAIVGTGKHMHTIFTDLCTGCELCIAPCPVDCIDLVTVSRSLSAEARQQEQDDLRRRYHTHLRRVTRQLTDKRNRKPVVSMIETKLNNATKQTADISEQQARQTIAAAKLRSKIKKLQKRLEARPNPSLKDELDDLIKELAQLP